MDFFKGAFLSIFTIRSYGRHYYGPMCMVLLGLFLLSFCSGIFLFYHQTSKDNGTHEVLIRDLSFDRANSFIQLVYHSNQVENIRLSSEKTLSKVSFSGKNHEIEIIGVESFVFDSNAGQGQKNLPSKLDNRVASQVAFVNENAVRLFTDRIRTGDFVAVKDLDTSPLYFEVKKVFSDFSTNRPRMTIPISTYRNLFRRNGKFELKFFSPSYANANAIFNFFARKVESRQIELRVPSEVDLKYSVDKTLLIFFSIGLILMLLGLGKITKKHQKDLLEHLPYFQGLFDQGKGIKFFLTTTTCELLIFTLPVSIVAIVIGTTSAYGVIRELFPMFSLSNVWVLCSQLLLLCIFGIAIPFIIKKYSNLLKEKLEVKLESV